jgi:hypothetical protein
MNKFDESSEDRRIFRELRRTITRLKICKPWTVYTLDTHKYCMKFRLHNSHHHKQPDHSN